ncbi:hypothetical protein PsorP6_015617 [Peronosclerospora sorghi]|uniref:Uncharacterized protein n=1 Tax=Peronosclerospora sorghi TaxID=230839 RepID=A0ACC0WP97_9STRA|nr:hypothetical protein PsorP6_015617 [Peronosclerospora sorghi]
MTKKPEEVRKMMVQTLLAQYTDQDLAQMKLHMWKTNGRSPDDVFELLELGKLKDDKDQYLSALFKSPQFDTWKEYLQLISN